MAQKFGTFDARTRELEERVGSGRLVGELERNQVYAKFQHESLDLRHPVGQAKFQETALFSHYRDYLSDLADKVLDGHLVEVMAEQMEALDRHSGQLTPKDLTILARSGNPRVRDGERVVYDRPPEVPRLTDEELADLHRKVRGFTNVPSV